jgi:hypothetical protein
LFSGDRTPRREVTPGLLNVTAPVKADLHQKERFGLSGVYVQLSLKTKAFAENLVGQNA